VMRKRICMLQYVSMQGNARRSVTRHNTETHCCKPRQRGSSTSVSAEWRQQSGHHTAGASICMDKSAVLQKQSPANCKPLMYCTDTCQEVTHATWQCAVYTETGCKGALEHATSLQCGPSGSSMRQVRHPYCCPVTHDLSQYLLSAMRLGPVETGTATACQTAKALATRAATCSSSASEVHHRKYSGTALLTSVMPAPLGGAWSNCTCVETVTSCVSSRHAVCRTSWPRVRSQGSQHSSSVHTSRQSTSTHLYEFVVHVLIDVHDGCLVAAPA
jgi:hypothetical protein